MELVMGNAHRSVLAFSSARSFLFLSSRTAAGFHKTSWFRNRADGDTVSLTLSNLEIENTRSMRKVSPIRVKAAQADSSKAASRKNVVKIDGAPFAAKSFSELGLSPLLIDRLEKQNLTAPTDVQSAAIPTISRKHDVVIQSYTGSGKTFGYLLPILSQIVPLNYPTEGDLPEQKPCIEAAIVAPSRELAMRMVREVEKLLVPENKKLVQQLVGGANRLRQEEALKKKRPSIVVGTPGRIAEISAAGKLHTHGCRLLVLDEVDQLLSFNYREDMHRILEHVGKRPGAKHSDMLSPLARRSERQTILVSATVPLSVVRAARSWGSDPLLVRAKSVAPLNSISGPSSAPLASISDVNSSSVTQGAIDSLPPASQGFNIKLTP